MGEDQNYCLALVQTGLRAYGDRFPTVLGWWARKDSNLRPTDYESAALTD